MTFGISGRWEMAAGNLGVFIKIYRKCFRSAQCHPNRLLETQRTVGNIFIAISGIEYWVWIRDFRSFERWAVTDYNTGLSGFVETQPRSPAQKICRWNRTLASKVCPTAGKSGYGRYGSSSKLHWSSLCIILFNQFATTLATFIINCSAPCNHRDDRCQVFFRLGMRAGNQWNEIWNSTRNSWLLL